MTAAVSRQDVEQFRSLVAEQLGLCFDDSRLGLLAEALRGQIEANNEANSGSGPRYLNGHASRHFTPGELGRLAESLTVTETYFYRNADQINAFVEIALPERLAACAAPDRVRILCAGCASGEEPYSLAMAIREKMPEAEERVSISAVDVNPAMLRKAAQARYSNWSLRELRASLKARWFRAEGGEFVLDAAVRRMVTFEEKNLAREDSELWRARSWDIVFCRNVIMYFQTAQAQSVAARIARAVFPGGYLYLGHAETLRGLSNDFHLCHTHDTFYYRRKEGIAEPMTMVATAPPERPSARLAPLDPEEATAWVDNVHRAAQRIQVLAQVSNDLAVAAVHEQGMADCRPDLHRTVALLRSEHFNRALEQLDTLSAEQARSPEARLLRMVSTLHSGALREAEVACHELLKRDEFSVSAHYVLALCRESSGDVEGAREQDQVAVYLDPGFAMARFHLGLLARRKGDWAAAHRELAQALPLLQREDAARLLLFGGGFSREALTALCRSAISHCAERK